MVHPWVMYGDKTGTDKIEKNSLEPFAISSAILCQASREDVSNWVILGYIPNLKATRGKKKLKSTTRNSRSLSNRDLHHCMSILIEPLLRAQSENPTFLFRRGDTIRAYKIVCPLMAVIGDNLSNDALSQRVADYGPTSPRLSRRCLCLPQEAENPIHCCHKLPGFLVNKLSMGALGVGYGDQDDGAVPGSMQQTVIESSPNLQTMKDYVTAQPSKMLKNAAISTRKHREALCDAILHQVMGCHSLVNAFHNIDFGPMSSHDGIHRSTLSDIMHTIEEGIVPMILHTFFHLMTDTTTADIDNYVQAGFASNNGTNVRNGEKAKYPRIAFRQGYTHLTNLSATERVGQLFMLSVLLQSDYGQQLLAPRFTDSFDHQRASSAARFQGICIGDDDGEISLDGDEQEGDDDKESDEDDGESIEGNPQTLSKEEIKAYLTSIQLEYVHKDLPKAIPTHHQNLLWNLLKNMIKRSWVNKASLHPNLPDLDYNSLINNPMPPSQKQPKSSKLWLPTQSAIEGAWNPNVASSDTKGDTPRTISLSMPEFSYLVETILTFHSCLKDPRCLGDKDPTTGEHKNFKRFARALSILLRVLFHGVRRPENSNQWRIRKIVELSHFLDDIMEYGCADGFNTSTGERNLKSWAKKPSATAQKRSAEVHSKQTSSRLHETFLLEQAIQLPREPEPPIESSTDDAALQTRLPSSTEKFLLEPRSGGLFKKKGSQSKMLQAIPVNRGPLSPIAINWFRERYHEEEFESPDGSPRKIQIFTEVYVDGDLCRAHANYSQGQRGPWYDCVAIDVNGTPVPGRLAAIFFDQEQEETSNRLRALVQRARSNKSGRLRRKDDNSQLFSHWELESTTNSNGGQQGGCASICSATLRDLPVKDILLRTFCIDVGKLPVACDDGTCDPFCRPVISSDGSTSRAFDIIWTDRAEWPETFLESPRFIKRLSKQISSQQASKNVQAQSKKKRTTLASGDEVPNKKRRQQRTSG